MCSRDREAYVGFDFKLDKKSNFRNTLLKQERVYSKSITDIGLGLIASIFYVDYKITLFIRWLKS